MLQDPCEQESADDDAGDARDEHADLAQDLQELLPQSRGRLGGCEEEAVHRIDPSCGPLRDT